MDDETRILIVALTEQRGRQIRENLIDVELNLARRRCWGRRGRRRVICTPSVARVVIGTHVTIYWTVTSSIGLLGRHADHLVVEREWLRSANVVNLRALSRVVDRTPLVTFSE